MYTDTHTFVHTQELTSKDAAESLRQFVGKEALWQLTEILFQQVRNIIRLKLIKVDGIYNTYNVLPIISIVISAITISNEQRLLETFFQNKV